MIIDVNSDYDIIKWKRNSEEWKIAPLEELIDCFVRLLWVFEIRTLVAKSKGNCFFCSRQRNKESATVFLRLLGKTPER